nr:lantibiotic (srt) production protein [Streptococcus mitis]
MKKIAYVLINLNNSDSEYRRLVKYQYSKTGITPAIKL